MTITFDYEKCTRCGLCASVCGSSCITSDEDTGVSFDERHSALCMSCGHCEAICPVGAIRCTGAGTYPDLPGPSIRDPTLDQLKTYLIRRRSTRHFTGEPVKRAVIEEILEVVRYAPSAGNNQIIRWNIISGKEEIERIADITVEGRLKSMAENSANLGPVIGARYAAMAESIKAARARGEDPVCRHAPHLVVAAVPASSPFRAIDAAIALTWFEIVAGARGLGTCWAGGVQLVADEYEPLRKALRIPEGYVSGYVMMLGHPRYQLTGVPARKPANITWIE